MSLLMIPLALVGLQTMFVPACQQIRPRRCSWKLSPRGCPRAT